MTATTLTSSTTRRHELLHLAATDLPEALARVVPFVLRHPEEASVLSDRGAVAATTPAGEEAFRTAVAAVVTTAVRAERRWPRTADPVG